MKKRMGICFLIITLCGVSVSAYTQDFAPFNKIEVRTTKPISFSYQSALDLLATKTISNALEVHIKIKQEDVLVMAQSQFASGVQDKFHQLLGLQLISRTSAVAQVPNESVLLSSAPSLLFIQPKSTEGVKHYSFYYNVFLKPSEVITPPGNHSFSILFTLTPQ